MHDQCLAGWSFLYRTVIWWQGAIIRKQRQSYLIITHELSQDNKVRHYIELNIPDESTSYNLWFHLKRSHEHHGANTYLLSSHWCLLPRQCHYRQDDEPHQCHYRTPSLYYHSVSPSHSVELEHLHNPQLKENKHHTVSCRIYVIFIMLNRRLMTILCLPYATKWH